MTPKRGILNEGVYSRVAKCCGYQCLFSFFYFFYIIRLLTTNYLQMVILHRLALIVPACQPGWEEMENLRGNLKKFEEI